MKKALVGTAVVIVVIAGVVVVLDQLRLLSDEPPIRVRNGSITLHAGVKNGTQWEWKADANGYDHEPGEWDISWDLWVRVDQGTGSNPCNKDPRIGNGDRVDVTFLSDGSERKISFNRIGPPWKVQTKVQPKTLLNPEGTTILRSIGEGYVTRVEVGIPNKPGYLTCTFNAKDQLDVINICTSDDYDLCQPPKSQ